MESVASCLARSPVQASTRECNETSAWKRERLLNPVDRISEILFGLIMAVTIVGSLSIATAAQTEIRTVMVGALGCNIAWGLVDAVMYLVRTATERSRFRVLAGHVRKSELVIGQRLVAQALPSALC
jgi:hypothetical protein